MITHGQPVPQDAEDADTQPAPRRLKSSSRLWLVPAVFGAVLLVLNAVFPLSTTYKWAYRFGSWNGGTNVILLAVSILTGLFLIVYAFGLWRFEQKLSLQSPDSAPRQTASHGLLFRVAVVVPLGLSLVGVLALWLGFMNASARFDPIQDAKPCVELYGDALAFSKERPNFRLPAKDPDEVRCGINKAVFG